jgi:sporulation protein YlmC with PRC-barrel domain
MKNRSLIAGLFALSMVVLSAAWAQVQRPSEAPTRTTDIPEDRGTAPSMMQDIQVETLSAQELRDKPVYDSKDEQIATVTDVTGTPGAGQGRQAILQTGGVLGVGGREVAVPLSKFSVGPEGRLFLNMTDDELKLLPKYR